MCCLAGAGQAASWPGIRAGDSRFEWSQEEACLSPAPPTYSLHRLYCAAFTASEPHCSSRTELFVPQCSVAGPCTSPGWVSGASAVAKLPLDGWLLVIMLILARTARHSRTAVVIWLYRRLSSEGIICHRGLKTIYLRHKVCFMSALETL